MKFQQFINGTNLCIQQFFNFLIYTHDKKHLFSERLTLAIATGLEISEEGRTETLSTSSSKSSVLSIGDA